MRKKLFKGFILIFFLAVLGIAIFIKYALHVHERALGEGTPYTIAELKELSKELDPAGSPGMVLPESLPNQLGHVLSMNDMKLRYSAHGRRRLNEIWMRSLFLKFEDGLAQMNNRPPVNGIHTPGAIGSDMLRLGEVELARRYYWKAVDTYKDTDVRQCKFSLKVLSKIEEDSERAALLLQLSCQGIDSIPKLMAQNLKEVYNYCYTRNSPELGDYYLERLWSEYPLLAKEYEANNEIPKFKVLP